MQQPADIDIATRAGSARSSRTRARSRRRKVVEHIAMATFSWRQDLVARNGGERQPLGYLRGTNVFQKAHAPGNSEPREAGWPRGRLLRPRVLPPCSTSPCAYLRRNRKRPGDCTPNHLAMPPPPVEPSRPDQRRPPAFFVERRKIFLSVPCVPAQVCVSKTASPEGKKALMKRLFHLPQNREVSVLTHISRIFAYDIKILTCFTN